MSFAGKRAVVTGAARGIGAAVAQHLINNGASVCVIDKTDDRLDRWTGKGVVRIAEDLSQTASAHRVIDAATAAMGGVDFLVHAAGVLKRTPFLEVEEQDWELHMQTNLRSTFFLVQQCARVMVAQGSGGRIVAVASDAWWSGGYDGSLAYAASKGGVVTLVRGVARELAAQRITVNVVAPGLVDTQMLRDELSPEQLARQAASVPSGRLAEPDDVAAVVGFILSEASAYMTGTVFNVSGGLLTY
ncbi:SDR family NAD(P)-dependent oxidoreductase [Micromonospora saelicesensis]|uniref:SDR family NAD(P)-dependent oxidoreductase n=1 Tax=Micromonospora saelicesensis TaxID=285676 RepID=UPI003CF21B08